MGIWSKIFINALTNKMEQLLGWLKRIDNAPHDKIVSLMERILELHKRSSRTTQKKESLARIGLAMAIS